MSWIGDRTFFLWQTAFRRRFTLFDLESFLHGTQLRLQNPHSGKIEVLINEPRREVDSIECDERHIADQVMSDESASGITVRTWLENGTDVNFKFDYGEQVTLVFASGMISSDHLENAQLRVAFEREFYRSFAAGHALGLVIGPPSSTYVDGVFHVDDWFREGGQYRLPFPDLAIVPYPLARSFSVDKIKTIVFESFGNGWTRLERTVSASDYSTGKIATEPSDARKSPVSREFES
jgi:hypothetical protein